MIFTPVACGKVVNSIAVILEEDALGINQFGEISVKFATARGVSKPPAG